jgi:hypothetical protein
MIARPASAGCAIVPMSTRSPATPMRPYVVDPDVVGGAKHDLECGAFDSGEPVRTRRAVRLISESGDET